MTLSDVKFIKGQGGLGQKLPGKDHYSGLLFFADNKPAAFLTEQVQFIADITDAESKGILADKSDETKATGGTVVITDAANTGSIETIKMQNVILGQYTVVTGDDENSIAAALADNINATTSQHGYTAIATNDTIELTPPDGLGASINGIAPVYESTDGGNATTTPFTGGVDAFFDVIHYHISEFFRINPGGALWVMMADVPTTYTFEEVAILQNSANGDLRQIGVLVHTTSLDTNHILSLQSVAEQLEQEHKPVSLILAPNIKNISDLSTLPDLHGYEANKVSVVIGQDGSGKGGKLFSLRPYSITALGALLGTVSKSKVSEDIGWVAKYKASDVELDVATIANGQIVSNIPVNLLNLLDEKGYVFLRKHIGLTGSYWNFGWTADEITSDYNTIERNRTIDKAIRGVRTYILPALNGPVKVDSDTGKLDITFIKYLESEAGKALLQMQKDGEISGYSVFIDPEQNVLSTNRVDIVFKIVPVGIAKEIVAKIGYSLKK